MPDSGRCTTRLYTHSVVRCRPPSPKIHPRVCVDVQCGRLAPPVDGRPSAGRCNFATFPSSSTCTWTQRNSCVFEGVPRRSKDTCSRTSTSQCTNSKSSGTTVESATRNFIIELFRQKVDFVHPRCRPQDLLSAQEAVFLRFCAPQKVQSGSAAGWRVAREDHGDLATCREQATQRRHGESAPEEGTCPGER